MYKNSLFNQRIINCTVDSIIANKYTSANFIMEKDRHEVIIIGAGISGIGASKILTQNNIGHLMLESRNRIGGRIVSSEFDGIKVELGASYVHCPNYKNNLINKYTKQHNWDIKSASYDNQTYFYQNQGILPHKIVQKSWNFFQRFKIFAQKGLKTTNGKDISVSQMYQQFSKINLHNKEEHLRNINNWHMLIYGNIEGAQLKNLSTKQYLDNDSQSSEDFLPVGGYSKVLQSIFSFCKPEIILQNIVISVDYSSELIKVTTNKAIYQCKMLISSLPLGVLQAQKVKFTPQLPLEYTLAIKNIRNGVANKLLVSFEKPFWGKRTGWLNFITKTQNNKYPVAVVVEQNKKHILCFFVSGDASLQISKWSDQAVVQDLLQFLGKFIKQQIRVKAIQMTRWHQDQYAMGSYSYCGVGTTHQQNINLLRKPVNNKLWFIGQYLHPDIYACAHAAYETGIWSGQQVAQVIKQIKSDK